VRAKKSALVQTDPPDDGGVLEISRTTCPPIVQWFAQHPPAGA
jgi:hypothetical protein